MDKVIVVFICIFKDGVYSQSCEKLTLKLIIFLFEMLSILIFYDWIYCCVKYKCLIWIGSSSDMRLDEDVRAWNCPNPFEDWDPTSNHCYKIFLKKLNWTNAESRCNMLNGNLISISSPRLSSIVINKMRNQDHLGHLWIGLTKEGIFWHMILKVYQLIRNKNVYLFIMAK